MRKYKLKEGVYGYDDMEPGTVYYENEKPEGAARTVREMVDDYPEDWTEVFNEEPFDLTKILKGCEGQTFYCTVLGDVIFNDINWGNLPLPICLKDNESAYFLSKEGKYYLNKPGECVLFPSKENRDWSTFKPVKEIDFGTPVMVLDVREVWSLALYDSKIHDLVDIIVPVSEFDFNNPNSNKERSIK